jgi:competence protein ComGF
MKINIIALRKIRNERGFTLVESIFTLMIAVMILSLIPLVIKAFNHIDISLSTEETYEWNTFLMQLRREIRNSEESNIVGNKLCLKVNGENVTYEQYGLLLRRRVNETGHEVVLQKVETATFSMVKNDISLKVTFTNDHQEIARFSFFNPI